jgi:endonuclease-3
MKTLTQKQKVKEVISRLSVLFPNPESALLHKSAWELLVATILSAQTTDKLVNTVTPHLFSVFPTVEDFAKASWEQIDAHLQKVNYHRNKARNIQATAQKIVHEFSGEVPDSLAELVSLPGVGRKTANVVLGDAFNKPEGIVVDTHVIRLANKLGLTHSKDPIKIEQDLMKIVPPEEWKNFPHFLILTGRQYCPARKHDCNVCPLHDLYIA